MRKFLFVIILSLPITGLILSCGSNSNTPTGVNTGITNPAATATPTPSVKTVISSFPAFSGGVSIKGLCVDSSDNLYVANYNSSNSSSNLMKVSSAGAATSITQMNGLSDVAYDGTNWYGVGMSSGGGFFFYNGTSTSSPFVATNGFQGVAINSAATTIALVSGSAVTLYGSAPGFSVIGNFTLTGSVQGPEGLAFDSSGRLYAALNNVVVRYTVGVSGATTIAGQATTGYVDGAATTTAEFNGLAAIAVDSNDNVYIADMGNTAIRKVSGSTVSTLIGPTGAGVTPAFTSPSLASPQGLAVDSSGNVFITDQISAGNKIYEYIP